MPNVTYTAAISIKENIQCSFQYQNCQVFSSDLKPLGVKETYDGVSGPFIIVSIDTVIKDFESVSDSAAYARPIFLIILDILSLFIDHPITPFDKVYSSYEKMEQEEKPIVETRLILNDKDLSNDLIKFLEHLDATNLNRQKYFYSLMDRWRKAAYMHNVSQEYDDEAVISYFHILELLVEEYAKELSEIIKKRIKKSLEDIYGGLLHLEGNYLDSQISSKEKLNNQLIISDLPITGKILFSLEKLGIIMSNRLKFLIRNWVNDRNSVAHGRRVYQDRVIFPIPPFFLNAKKTDYTLNTLRYLTANVICKLIADIDTYDERWQHEHDMLIPTPEEMKNFISNNKYYELTNEQFINGDIYDITPGSISWYLVHKKIEYKDAILVLNNFFININLKDSEQIYQTIIAAVILADCAGELLEPTLEKIIIESYKNEWHPFINLRELLKYLEYNGHSPKFLENMIIDKIIR